MKFQEWYEKEEYKIKVFIDNMKPEFRKEYYLRKGYFANDDKIKALEEKLKIAVEALEYYDTTCYDGHDYSAKEISKYAKESLEKIKGEK
jgi:hypothetical protein